MSYVLTDKDQKTYSDCYGVEVKYNNVKFNYSGYAEQVSKVSGMVNKNKFLKENGHKVASYKSKKGSMSSHLVDYNTSSDYEGTEYREGMTFSFS